VNDGEPKHVLAAVVAYTNGRDEKLIVVAEAEAERKMVEK
jgi:hypothetical protein